MPIIIIVKTMRMIIITIIRKIMTIIIIAIATM